MVLIVTAFILSLLKVVTYEQDVVMKSYGSAPDSSYQIVQQDFYPYYPQSCEEYFQYFAHNNEGYIAKSGESELTFCSRSPTTTATTTTAKTTTASTTATTTTATTTTTSTTTTSTTTTSTTTAPTTTVATTTTSTATTSTTMTSTITETTTTRTTATNNMAVSDFLNSFTTPSGGAALIPVVKNTLLPNAPHVNYAFDLPNTTYTLHATNTKLFRVNWSDSPPTVSTITTYSYPVRSMSLWSTTGTEVVITTHDISGFTGSKPPVPVKLWETKDLGVTFGENTISPSSSPAPVNSTHIIKEAAIIWTDTIVTGTDHGDVSVYMLVYSSQIKMNQVSYFQKVLDGEVSKIQGYGTAGNFVVAIKGGLYFFVKSDSAATWTQAGAKTSVHDYTKINLLLVMSANIFVTGSDDPNQQLKAWDVSNIMAATPSYDIVLVKNVNSDGKVKGGCKSSETAFYTVGETINRMVKWDIALNRIGYSKTYSTKVKTAAIRGSTLVIGTESGEIESFNN